MHINAYSRPSLTELTVLLSRFFSSALRPAPMHLMGADADELSGALPRHEDQVRTRLVTNEMNCQPPILKLGD